MGKKHKKHHKSEKKSHEEEGSGDKPLRLVLKVGGATPESGEFSSEHHEKKHHKHKKKKKKKSSDKDKERHKHHHSDSSEKHEKREKRKHVEEPVKEEERDKETSEPVAKKALIEVDEAAVAKQRETRSAQGPATGGYRLAEDGEPSTLRQCLDYLCKTLSRRDMNGFFAYPVNDMIAPGYSSIITRPMDFSSMQNNIDEGLYRNVMEFKQDFKLMCNNAMVYNRSETVYYKSARKLLDIGSRMMSKDKLLALKRTQSFMANITAEELGLDEDEAIDVVIPEPVILPPKPKKVPKPKTSIYKFEAIPDNLTPREILEQAQAAAKHAKDKLTLRDPNSRMGFLRRQKDGSTSFNIINPDNDGKVSETERVISIGGIIGKLTSGSGSLAGFKEDKRNKASAVSYLSYGPFSSYAPSYDSTFANLSKEESDILLSTYGDDTGFQYAQSLKDFVSGASEYAINMVDNLLDILTSGQHSKSIKTIEAERKRKDDEERKQIEEDELALRAAAEADTVDYASLRTLSKLGIDVSFLNEMEKESREKKEVEEQLANTGQLITALQKTQYERLSQKVPSHLAHVPGPTDKEKQLAAKVSKGLTELAKKASPADLISAKAVRQTLGVGGDDKEHHDELDNDDNQSQVLTHLSEEGAADMDRDLKDFLEQGPMLRVSDSPTMFDEENQ